VRDDREGNKRRQACEGAPARSRRPAPAARDDARRARDRRGPPTAPAPRARLRRVPRSRPKGDRPSIRTPVRSRTARRGTPWASAPASAGAAAALGGAGRGSPAIPPSRPPRLLGRS
jgi:hypothetical protein